MPMAGAYWGLLAENQRKQDNLPSPSGRQSGKTTRPTSSAAVLPTITMTGLSTPDDLVPHMPNLANNTPSIPQINPPSDLVPKEAVFGQALNLANSALPKPAEPKGGKDKFKSRMRRALLRNWLLKMMIGERATDWAYPWIHPKARTEGWPAL